MKALGIEIKQFWNDEEFDLFKQEKIYWDGDVEFEFDELKDDEKYDLTDLGCFICDELDIDYTFEQIFKKWKKQQTTTTIVIEVEKSKVNEVMLLLKDNKIKVVK